MDHVVYNEINDAKADMDHIYNKSNPTAYFRELEKLGYIIPDAAKPIFQELISHLQRRRNEPLHMLDLGCSYGVNAALLKHDLSMRDLYEHWGQQRLADANREEIIAYDKRYLAQLETAEDIKVTGLDQAERAVGFAEDVGLLDEGLAINLEKEQLPESVKEDLATVDLVTSTGCVGYVTEKTFDCLLSVFTQRHQPWLANFVLRMFPFDGIAEILNEWGFVTEKLEGHAFVQRRFATAKEKEEVLKNLRLQGLDPTGMETQGHLLAEFYLSRPMKDAAEVPIERIFGA